VQELFDAMKGQLGAKIADMWQGVDPSIVEREWQGGLAGFRGHELQRGLVAMAGRKFAPTLGEFANMCRPALDPEYAWHEARECLEQRERGERGDWTHPGVFFAAINMKHELRSNEWKKHRAQWARALARSMDQGWRDIPEVPPRVEKNPPAPPVPAPSAVQAYKERLKREQAEKALKDNEGKQE
jgi:hypothetical protein